MAPEATCRVFKKAVQQGRSERKGESYSVLYVEPLSDPRTPLADYFNALLGVTRTVRAAVIGVAFVMIIQGVILSNSTIADPSTPRNSSVADRPRIVAFGDSLTAGLGVSAEESYPAQLQRRLDGAGLRYRVVNAGVSGDTTAGGLRRVAWVLYSKPRIVILELGANDGLRGLSLQETRGNLERIIRQFQAASVTVILAGMKLPPNYGVEYTTGFETIYRSLAQKYHLTLIPFFLDGVAGSTSLNQADGIHPTGEGYQIVADRVLQVVKPLLEHEK